MFVGKITRQQFLSSRCLSIKLVDLEKSLIHRNRFVFEIVTDRTTDLVKKTYSELKHFSAELVQRNGMQEFSLGTHIRSSQQYKQVEAFIKKLSGGYLTRKDQETDSPRKNNIRNYLYNLFYAIVENPSSDQEEGTKETVNKSNRKFSQNAEPEVIRKNSCQALEGKQQFKLEKRVTKQKTDHYLHKLKNIYRWKKEQPSDEKTYFSEKMWVREGQDWYEREVTLSENMLIISEEAPSPKHIYVMKKFEIYLAEQNYRRIRINHKLLVKEIELRMRPMSEVQKDSQDLEQYIWFLTKFKEAALAIPHFQEEVVNYISIRMSNKKNKFSHEDEKRPSRELYFKLVHEFDVICFPMQLDCTINVLFPITNHYGKIEGTVVESREVGIIPNFRQNSINFNVPIQNIYDYIYNPKPKRKTPEIRFFLLSSKICNYSIKLDYYEKTNRLSYSTMKSQDVFQGQKQPTQFSRAQFRIQKNRFKRILYSVEQYINCLRSLFNFQYPYQSYLFYLILSLAIIFFDANYLVHYTLFLITGLMIYNNPSFSSWCRQLICIFGLTQKMRVFNEKMKIRVRGNKAYVNFKVDLEKKCFLQQFKFTRKAERSFMQKYNRFQLMLLKGQLVLTEIVTMCEKIKNIFIWYHHRKTKQLLFVLLVILLVILFLPIKLILLIAVFKMFKKGLTHRVRTRQINKVIIFEIFHKLVQQHNFNEVKAYILDRNRLFDRRHHEYIQFEKKSRQWMNNTLGVQIDADLFVESKSMNELLNNLSDCKRRFLIPPSICAKYSFNKEWSKAGGSVSRLIFLIRGFISNIPSDRNILGISEQEVEKEAQYDSDDMEM